MEGLGFSTGLLGFINEVKSRGFGPSGAGFT